MVEIEISEAERQSKALNSDNLAKANRALVEDGYVVMLDVVDPAHIEILRTRMLEDVSSILARSDVPTQFAKGNIQQDPPPYLPFLFRDVLVNPFVIQATKSVLGAGLHNNFYSGNTNLPGSQPQPVHADYGQLWPNLQVAHPAFSYVINLPLIDVNEHNGSTEIWPGTHTDTTVTWQGGDIKVPADVLERRRAEVPPLQPKIRAGSALIRDMRLWHRGVTNHSEQIRPMIAMIHNVAWFPGGELVFEEGTEAIFANSDLRTDVKFVSGEIPYLSRHTEYDVQGK